MINYLNVHFNFKNMTAEDKISTSYKIFEVDIQNLRKLYQFIDSNFRSTVSKHSTHLAQFSSVILHVKYIQFILSKYL